MPQKPYLCSGIDETLSKAVYHADLREWRFFTQKW